MAFSYKGTQFDVTGICPDTNLLSGTRSVRGNLGQNLGQVDTGYRKVIGYPFWEMSISNRHVQKTCKNAPYCNAFVFNKIIFCVIPTILGY